MTCPAMKFTASLDSLVCSKSPSLQLIGLVLWRTFCRASGEKPLSKGTRHSESSGEDEVGMAEAAVVAAGMAAAEVEEAVDVAILAGGAWKLSPSLSSDEVTDTGAVAAAAFSAEGGARTAIPFVTGSTFGSSWWRWRRDGGVSGGSPTSGGVSPFFLLELERFFSDLGGMMIDEGNSTVVVVILFVDMILIFCLSWCMCGAWEA